MIHRVHSSVAAAAMSSKSRSWPVPDPCSALLDFPGRARAVGPPAALHMSERSEGLGHREQWVRVSTVPRRYDRCLRWRSKCPGSPHTTSTNA